MRCETFGARRRAASVLLAALVALTILPLHARAEAAYRHHPVAHLSLSTKIDSYLQLLTRDELFSGDVLIARDGEIVTQHAYGPANWRRHLPNTLGTAFRIGSITKQFTALAILLLQQWGKLRIGDRICSYIPRCPKTWRAITIYELLTHTSGIPDRFNDSDYNTTRHATPAELLRRFRDRPLNFAPGTNWAYSNAGYGVLGYIISRASGHSYTSFLQRYVFRPLHLRDTGVGPKGPPLSRQAVGYQSWGVPAPYINLSTAYAFADVISTVDDLYTWDQALFSDSFLPRRATRAMFAPHVEAHSANGYVFHYGYAWFIEREENHLIIDHPGLINGFASVNEYLPDDKVTIIVLSNLQNADVPAICTELRKLVLGR